MLQLEHSSVPTTVTPFSLSDDGNVNLMEEHCPAHALKVNVNNKAVHNCSTRGRHKTVSVDVNVGSESNLQ